MVWMPDPGILCTAPEDAMLILTRKPGETVVIGEEVRITVLAVRGSQIKLGIDAPREVRVNREEVLEREARDWVAAQGETGHSTQRYAPDSAGGPERQTTRRAGPGEVIEGGGQPRREVPHTPPPARRGAPATTGGGQPTSRRSRRNRDRSRRDTEAA